MEQSPPRQKGAGGEVVGLVPSLALSQPRCDSGLVTFLSGLVSSLFFVGREGVGSRVGGLCPQAPTITEGPGETSGTQQWGTGALDQLGGAGALDPCQPGYWGADMVSVGPLGFQGGLRLQYTGPDR